MINVVFVTGNAEKAKSFSRHMGSTITHTGLDLDEIQTLDAKAVVEHKIKQAYQQVQQPVLVEDVTFSFESLNGLPGPFIKFFVDVDGGVNNMCRMLDGFESRRAVAQCVYGYYDGNELRYFEGSIAGGVALEPRGENGFGFDKIFIPDGFDNKTAAELDETEYDAYYSTIKPFADLKDFLEQL